MSGRRKGRSEKLDVGLLLSISQTLLSTEFGKCEGIV